MEKVINNKTRLFELKEQLEHDKFILEQMKCDYRDNLEDQQFIIKELKKEIKALEKKEVKK